MPGAPGGDEEALKSSAAIHLEGAGFPWEDEPNVHLVGHRLGFAGTVSHLEFWNLNKLENGDEIYILDSFGSRLLERSVPGSR